MSNTYLLRYLRPIFSLILLLMFFKLSSQTTTGNNSPVLAGQRASLKYELTHDEAINIPENYRNFLYGLLLLNKVEDDSEQVKSAIQIWLNRFADLQEQLQGLPEEKKVQAQQLLMLGKLDEVADLLSSSSSNSLLQRLLAPSFKTTGDNSPIVVGDYANVNYAVKTVINYQLPEAITQEVFAQLKKRDESIQKLAQESNQKTQEIFGLQAILKDKEEAIRNWVQRYQKLELQLQYFPDSIASLVRSHFQAGNYEEALKAFDQFTASKVAMKESSLIKATILQLALDKDYDSRKIQEIDQLYQLAYRLAPEISTVLDYGDFLIEYTSEVGKAVLQLDDYETPEELSIADQIRYHRIMAHGYVSFNQLKSLGSLRKAFQLALTNKHKYTVNLALELCDLLASTSQASKIKKVLEQVHQEEELNNSLLLFQKVRMKYFESIVHLDENQLDLTLEDLEAGLRLLDQEPTNSLSIALLRNHLLYELAGFYAIKGNYNQAIEICYQALEEISPYVNGGSQRIFSEAFRLYYNLVTYQMGLGLAGNVTEAGREAIKFIDDLPIQHVINLETYRTEMLFYIGYDLYIRQQYPSAKDTLQIALQFYEENVREQPWDYMEMYTTILDCLHVILIYEGKTQSSLDLLEKHLPTLEEAVAVAPTQFYQYQAQVNSLITGAYINLEIPQRAIQYAFKALDDMDPYLARAPEGALNYYLYNLEKAQKLLLQEGRTEEAHQLFARKLRNVELILIQHPESPSWLKAHFLFLVIVQHNLDRRLDYDYQFYPATYFDILSNMDQNQIQLEGTRDLLHFRQALAHIIETQIFLLDKAKKRRTKKRLKKEANEFLERCQSFFTDANLSPGESLSTLMKKLEERI